MSLFRLVPTGLDLNGPDLSFTTNPVGVATSTVGIATFIGFATATFATVGDVSNSPNNLGIITYRWHQVGVGSVTDGTTSAGSTITGAGTTIITITNPTNDINQAEYFLQADYVPESISGVTSVSLGGVFTGNAPNEPLNSGIGTLTVFPEITIVTQPQEETVATGATHTFSLYATATDGTTDFSYQWSQDGVDLTDSSTVAGSATTELSISSTTIGVSTISCKVSHNTANPSPVYSSVVDYDVTAPRNVIKYETFSENSTTLNSSGSHDLSEGGLSFRADTSAATRSITIYPSETNSEVKITMGGSRGDSQSGRRRGYGGISVFKITLLKNTEYTIKLGVPYSANLAPQGGNPGGGGSAVLYRKANVIAVCGGGGGAGTLGRGGDGGGVGLAGEGGQGINGGGGGEQILTGAMGTSGSYATVFGSETSAVNFLSTNDDGGFLSKCTVGDYYASQGFAPCQDLGTNVQARTYDGDIISGSAAIDRGYKAGFGYRENGGNAVNEYSGGGGAGARGGDGPALGGNGGGGGGSGYSNGEITLLTSTTLSTGTRIGGNDDTAFIVIESTDEASDNEPVFPAASSI